MSQAKRPSKWSEFMIAGFGLIALLAAEGISSSVIPGTHYSQGDGKMAQAVIHTALKFGGIFHVNNINPLQGFGSQLQPHNVWRTPLIGPSPFSTSPLALDVSALIALGCLALACYIMARCFDVQVLPSIVAAQLSIILFGPLAYLFVFYQVFWINPGIAVVYAPQLVALGIIGRLEPGRIRDFMFVTGSVFALLLYSLSCDPLWAMISGIGLLAAFVIVALSPLRIRPVLVRCAALGCCLVLLLISGAIGYVYTLSQYSGRVWFSDAARLCAASLLVLNCVYFTQDVRNLLRHLHGGMAARNIVRPRPSARSGHGRPGKFRIYRGLRRNVLLMRKWWWPLPLYIEHSLFPLFTTAAIAGYWSALGMIRLPLFLRIKEGRLASLMPLKHNSATPLSCLTPGIFRLQQFRTPAAWLTALLVAASIPTTAAIYAVRAGPTAPDFDVPFPNEPELVGYFEKAIGLHVGGDFRGSVTFVVPFDGATMSNLWIHGIPTVNEYSQLLTPQATYFSAALFKHDIVLGKLNQFGPWIGLKRLLRCPTPDVAVTWRALYHRLPPLDVADQRHFPFVTFPRRPVGQPARKLGRPRTSKSECRQL